MINTQFNRLPDLYRQICARIDDSILSEIDVASFMNALIRYKISQPDMVQILSIILHLIDPSSEPLPPIVQDSIDYINDEIVGLKGKPRNFIAPPNNLVNTEIGMHRIFLNQEEGADSPVEGMNAPQLAIEIHEATKQEFVLLALKHAPLILKEGGSARELIISINALTFAYKACCSYLVDATVFRILFVLLSRFIRYYRNRRILHRFSELAEVIFVQSVRCSYIQGDISYLVGLLLWIIRSLEPPFFHFWSNAVRNYLYTEWQNNESFYVLPVPGGNYFLKNIERFPPLISFYGRSVEIEQQQLYFATGHSLLRRFGVRAVKYFFWNLQFLPHSRYDEASALRYVSQEHIPTIFTAKDQEIGMYRLYGGAEDNAESVAVQVTMLARDLCQNRFEPSNILYPGLDAFWERLKLVKWGGNEGRVVAQIFEKILGSGWRVTGLDRSGAIGFWMHLLHEDRSACGNSARSIATDVLEMLLSWEPYECLTLKTESSWGIDNIVFNNRRLGTCVSGLGQEKEAILGYQCDPNIGLLFLVPKIGSVEYDAVGIVYVVSARERATGKLFWVVDDIDIGVHWIRSLRNVQWMTLIVSGLINEAGAVPQPRKPDQVVVNANVSGKSSSQRFIKFILEEAGDMKCCVREYTLDKPAIPLSAVVALKSDQQYLLAWAKSCNNVWNKARGVIEAIRISPEQ